MKENDTLRNLSGSNGTVGLRSVTGIKRCGKSTLLFEIFKDYLYKQGVHDSNIISIALDDDLNSSLRDPGKLSSFVRERTSDKDQKYYVLIDEIQYAISKEELRDKDAPVRL